MRMNSSIPMGVQPFNALDAFSGGAQAAGMVNEVQRRNALARVQEQFGDGIMRGDPNALAQLAAVDSGMARDIQQQVETGQREDRRFEYGQQRDAVGDSQWAAGNARAERADGRAERQFQFLQEEQVRQVEAQAREMDAAESSAAADRTRRAVQGASMAQTPEEWDRFMAQNDMPDMVGRFEDRDMLLGTYMEIADVFEAAQGPEAAQPLTPEGQRTVDIREGFIDPNAPPAPMETPTAVQSKEAEIARLMETGIPRETAIAIADGILQLSRDPMTGEAIIVDMRQGPGRQQQPEEPIGAANPPMQQPAPPTGADEAFGVGGVARGAANAVTDTIGMGQVFPNAAEQDRFFSTLREDITNEIAQSYDRQPAQEFMKQIQALAPAPGTLQGPESARGSVTTLRQRFQRDLRANTRVLQQRLSPSERSKILREIQGAERAIEILDEALARFGSEASVGEGQTQGGVSWRVVE